MSEQPKPVEASQNHITVRLTAKGLPDDSIKRLDRALQRALLVELADLSIAATQRIQLTKSVPNKGDKPEFDLATDGIYVELPEDVKLDT